MFDRIDHESFTDPSRFIVTLPDSIFQRQSMPKYTQLQELTMRVEELMEDETQRHQARTVWNTVCNDIEAQYFFLFGR